MLVQAEQHMAITAINPDQISARQHSQDSAFSHLNPTTNQTIHVQVGANYSSTPGGNDVRLQRLQMLQEGLKNEATSSKDPRSQAYATLHERTINPELRSQHFLEIPVTRQGLIGGRGESSRYAINEKREEISQSQQRLDSLRDDLRGEQQALQSADEDEAGPILNNIISLQASIHSEQSRLSSLQRQLSHMERNS